MAFAPARVAPPWRNDFRSRYRYFYVGLFIFAQYLVNRWQVPLPANPGRHGDAPAADRLPGDTGKLGARRRRWLLAEMLLFSSRRWSRW